MIYTLRIKACDVNGAPVVIFDSPRIKAEPPIEPGRYHKEVRTSAVDVLKLEIELEEVQE